MSKNKNIDHYLEVERTFFPRKDAKLHSIDILNAKYLEGIVKSKRLALFPAFFWPAERYGLERSLHFKKLPEDAKQRVLSMLSKWNLNLSYFIETSGAHYAAKMILLSETEQEKALYSIFAHDELVHKHEFLNFMQDVPLDNIDFHPLLKPLGKALRDSGRGVLVYIVQVLLEGFGLGHYASLRRDCLSPELKDVFGRILIDEARHHGAGLILREHANLSSEELDQIFELSREFISALQNAHWAVSALERELGEFSGGEKEDILEQIDLPKIKDQRRLKLRELIAHSLPENTYIRLESEKIL